LNKKPKLSENLVGLFLKNLGKPGTNPAYLRVFKKIIKKHEQNEYLLLKMILESENNKRFLGIHQEKLDVIN
jgi:hypothetical protein